MTDDQKKCGEYRGNRNTEKKAGEMVEPVVFQGKEDCVVQKNKNYRLRKEIGQGEVNESFVGFTVLKTVEYILDGWLEPNHDEHGNRVGASAAF